MKTRAFRISTTIIALSIGALIVVALAFAGKKTKGPLENFFSYTGETVQNVEQKIIIERRENKRADKIKWLNEYRKNPALLLNPKLTLLGAYDNNTKTDFESVIGLEDSLKTTFPLIHIYCAWGGKPEEEFPKLQVKSILELGSIPVITWEPWLTDFDIEKYPQLKKPELRDKKGLTDVAKGVYDFYIREWAQEAAKINSPIFLRVGHEMNDPYRYPWGPQNNTAKEYIAAWKHIRAVFKQQGASNVLWVWSPHPAYGFFKEFYPGDSLVDVVGVSALNYGTVASWSKWWTFQEIFGNHYADLAYFKKPIMISEFGSLAVGGSRSQWFAAALDSLPEKYPLVKSLVFFHFSDDKTTTQQSINWYIKDDQPSTTVIKNEINKWK